MPKQTKVMTRRRKFINVDVPVINQKLELIGNSIEDVLGRTIKLDMTRQLKGKSVEVVVKVDDKNGKAVAHPTKLKLMSYFIRRIIRKRISYVEDSFEASSQNSILRIKPFLITRNRVSRVVRKTLRNKAKNWLIDYVAGKTDEDIFNEILGNRMQRPLSLMLKKTYPLSFCEIRVLEIVRPLNEDELKEVKKIVKEIKIKEEKEEEFIDQMKEVEEERVKRAEAEMKKVQAEVSKKEAGKVKEDEEEVEAVKKKVKKAEGKDKKVEKKDSKKKSDEGK